MSEGHGPAGARGQPAGAPGDAPGALQSAVFLSDVHLNDAEPRTVAAFFAFLEQPQVRGAAALYILGDLFEYWAGDDDLLDPLAQRVVTTLQGHRSLGQWVGFLTGNRDLLIGPGFSTAADVMMLHDGCVLSVAGRSVVICHGDALCTDDVAYQQYRARVRSAPWQEEFLAKPLVERKEIIGSLRMASETAKANKPEAIMDVNADAVAELLRTSGATLLVHGHTHRPGLHRLVVDGRSCERWVLPDWSAEDEPRRGGALLIDAAGAHLLSLDA